jgi:hypothetical protein
MQALGLTRCAVRIGERRDQTLGIGQQSGGVLARVSVAAQALDQFEKRSSLSTASSR